MSDQISKFLNNIGWGVMSLELRDIFIAHGCAPACHICNETIEQGANFHLKPFVFIEREPAGRIRRASYADEVKESDTFISYAKDGRVEGEDEDVITTTVQVMLCQKCSRSGKPLPADQAEAARYLAEETGGVTPRKHPPGKVKYPARPSYGGCFLVTRGKESQIVANSEI